MQNTSNGKLGEGLRQIDLAYRARFPEKSTDLMNSRDAEIIKNLLLLTNDDHKYIVGIISGMNKTASGEVPGWAYIAKVVKSEYEKKKKPVGTKTEAELLAMCQFTPRQMMYDNITQTIMDDTVAGLPISGWDDPNIMKAIRAFHEDGRISDEMLADAITGHKVLIGELDGLGKLISVNEIMPETELADADCPF